MFKQVERFFVFVFQAEGGVLLFKEQQIITLLQSILEQFVLKGIEDTPYKDDEELIFEMKLNLP